MKQGCLLINGALVAKPDVFDAITDAFNLIRVIEIGETGEVIFIVEHEEFINAEEDHYLPFYEPVFENHEGEITCKSIGTPYIHSKYFIKCQNQKESPRKGISEEDLNSLNSLIWMP